MKRIIEQRLVRELEHNTGKVVLIIGQRQIGKTFELKKLMNTYPDSLYFDFEDLTNQEIFQPKIEVLESILGSRNSKKIVLFDEFQYMQKSGSILKLLHDHFPKFKIVATGSSTFLLLKNIGDSLYGRNIVLNMFPLSPRELVSDVENRDFKLGNYGKVINKAKIDAQLDNLMLYGSLPSVYLEQDKERKRSTLNNHVLSLLYKDILEIEGIRMPQTFKQLLKLLALQLGNEVNPNELAQQLEIDRKTVVEYIGMYEKFRIIQVLNAFNTNQRSEITKGFKVYFSDLGIRNAVIDNFIPIQNRNDVGALFENLVVNTFNQNIEYLGLPYKSYFWRTAAKAEVDLVLTDNTSDRLIPIEIKLNKLIRPSKSFKNLYEGRVQEEYTVTRETFWKFI